MLCVFDTGIIFLRNNVLTWKLSKFFRLPLDIGCEIRTQEFVFAEKRFTLAIWPRGQKGGNEEWFGICLYTYDASQHVSPIQFSIMRDGRAVKSCHIECSENGLYRNDRFMKWSEFLLCKNEFAPEGCLTIVCRLPLEYGSIYEDSNGHEGTTKSTTNVNELGVPLGRNSNILFQSGDYSCPGSHTPTIMIGPTSSGIPGTSCSDLKSGVPSSINSFFSASDSVRCDGTCESLSKLKEFSCAANFKTPFVAASNTQREQSERFCNKCVYDFSPKSKSKQQEETSKPPRVISEITALDSFKNASLSKPSEIKPTSVTPEDPKERIISRPACSNSPSANRSGAPRSPQPVSASPELSAVLEEQSESAKINLSPNSVTVVTTNDSYSDISIANCNIHHEASEENLSDNCDTPPSEENKMPTATFFSPDPDTVPIEFDIPLKSDSRNYSDSDDTGRSRKLNNSSKDAFTQTEIGHDDATSSGVGKKDQDRDCWDDNSSSTADVARSRRKIRSFETLSHNLKKLYLDGTVFDLTIKIEDREFRALKAILGARSKTFARLLSNTEGEKITDVLSMDGDPAVFDDLLLYLHSGDLEIVSCDNMCGLYCTAHTHELQELKEECVEFMKKSLSTETICDVMSLAMKYNEEELLKQGTIFFAWNLKEILDTDNWKLFLKENHIQATKLIQDAVDIGYVKRTV